MAMRSRSTRRRAERVPLGSSPLARPAAPPAVVDDHQDDGTMPRPVCSICQDANLTPRVVVCGHMYCHQCWQEFVWQAERNGRRHVECPECRRSMSITLALCAPLAYSMLNDKASTPPQLCSIYGYVGVQNEESDEDPDVGPPPHFDDHDDEASPISEAEELKCVEAFQKSMAHMFLAALASLICIVLSALVFSEADRIGHQQPSRDTRHLALLSSILGITSAVAAVQAVLKSPCYQGTGPPLSEW